MPNNDHSLIANKSLLKNAWERILTASDIPYKNMLRMEIEAFGTLKDSLFDLITQQLEDETYEPQQVYRYNLVKSKYSNRTIRILSIPDYIVYTGIATLISEAASEKQSHIYDKVLFSNVPLSHAYGRKNRFFKKWQRQYTKYNNLSKKFVREGYVFLGEIDITAFYDFIDHGMLFSIIRKYFDDTYSLELLEHLLQSWSANDPSMRYSHGLPQGPDASRYLADLFLLDLDEYMIEESANCKYVRYVDDIRIFCKEERIAHAYVLKLEELIKLRGLVPNVSKMKVTNAQKNLDWLKEESSEALSMDGGISNLAKGAKTQKRLKHIISKEVFLNNCVTSKINNKNTYLTRRSIGKLLPDKEVVERIIKSYTIRVDLQPLFYNYLQECNGMPEIERFCWRVLKLYPVSDHESANLLSIVTSLKTTAYTKSQLSIINSYMENKAFVNASAQAASLLIRKKIVRPTASFTKSLSQQAFVVQRWLIPIMNLKRKRNTIPYSTRAIIKGLLKYRDTRTNFIVSYLVATRYSQKAITSLPSPQCIYSRQLLANLGASTSAPQVDTIAAILSRTFRVKIPNGFDFRNKFTTVDSALYSRALRSLQLATWYYETSPTHFMNHIHNFNHVLLHFALISGNYVTHPPLRWKHTFNQIQPNQNISFQSSFRAVTYAFNQCRIARNTNLSSHPYDDRYSRSTKHVSYPERNRIKSLLTTAYREFMNTV